jgi:hypothetical protein
MISIPPELEPLVGEEGGGLPVRLTNPRTHDEYVLISAEEYDRLQGTVISHDSLTKDEQRAALIAAGLRAGWDDPAMDIYNDLDPRLSP